MGRWGARSTPVVLGLGLFALLLAPGAGAAKPGGTIDVFVQGSGVTTPILVTGAITDYGRATSVTKTGKVDQNGDYERVVLKQGSFWIDATALNKRLNTVVPTIDRKRCFFEFAGSGATTLFKGTGAYAGIGGTVTVQLTAAAILPKLGNGKCNLAQSAKPVAQYETVTGSGDVTFK